jgi:hypothetical protein
LFYLKAFQRVFDFTVFNVSLAFSAYTQHLA